MEAEDQTRYEVYVQLQQERSIACGSDVGHNMRKEAWERIDVLLDWLIDINAIGTLIEVKTV